MWMIIIVSLLCKPGIHGLVEFNNPNHLVGYDCSHTNLNYSIIDMSSVTDCPEIYNPTISKTEMIQLVEITNTVETNAFHCSIIVNRHISECARFSHVSLVRGGMMSYPLNIGRGKCLQAIETGELTLFQDGYRPLYLSNLQPGKSYHYSHTISGAIYADATCKGSDYSDTFGSWEDVVVESHIQIMLQKFTAVINTDTNTVVFPSGISCSNDKDECKDDMSGEYFWVPLSSDSCNSYKHKVLYEGAANFTYQLEAMSNVISKNDPPMVTVANEQMLFSLLLKQKYDICNIEAYRTEHPKLIIIRSSGLSFLFKKSKIQSSELDMFSYINSKFVTIERNIKTNMEELYQIISRQRCLLDKSSLQIKLAMGLSSPADFGKLLSGENGYMATPIGDVVYLTQCEPVYVRIRQTSSCFTELPVYYQNMSYFLSPRTKLLQTYGTEVTCNSVYLPLYHIMSKWYRLHPSPIEVPSPITLGPKTPINWEYKSLNNLATVGIYTQNNLDSLRSHIMFKIERSAVETVLTRQFQGLDPNPQGLNTLNLITEKGIEELGEKIWTKVWSAVSLVGNVSSGVIGILLIAKCVKWLVNSILNGAILYDTFGWSFKILGCVIDGLTSFFIHWENRRNRRSQHAMSAGEQEDDSAVRLSIDQPGNSSGQDGTNPNSGGSQTQALPMSDLKAPVYHPSHDVNVCIPRNTNGYRLYPVLDNHV